MGDQDKTKGQLINERMELRQRIAELETSEAGRKRAEEALKESEAKYKSLFEGSHEAILLADPETGRFVDCNRKAEELSGYSRDEILCMKIGQFTPGDIKGETADEFQKLIAEQGIQKEWEILTKDGNRMPVEISSTLIRVGNKSYLQGVVRDITERKRAERTLRESEERFRTSVENLLEGFAFLSPIRDSHGQLIDFKYEFINEIGCKMNQKAREEHIGGTLLKLFPEEKEIGLFDDYVEVIETGQPVVKEHVIYEPVYGGSDRLKQAFDVRISRLEDGIVVTWQDITEKKRGEELLRQSEERLKRLVENSKDIIVMADLDGEVLYYNGPPGYGVRKEDVLGKNPFSIFEPAIAASLMNQLKLVIKGGEALTFENMIPWRGESFWFFNQMYPIRDEKGRMIAVGLIARNITERRQAEEALRESEENFKALAENANDGIVIGTGEGGWHVYANRRAVEITGYPIEELLKTRLKDLAYPDELPKLTERYKKRLAGLEVPKPYETALLNKDGIKVPVEISLSKTTWQNQPADMVILHDVTERKRAEEALRENEAYFSTIFHASPVSIAITGLKDNTLVDVNEAWQKITGFTREEVIGHTPIALNTWVNPDERDRLISKLHGQGTLRDIEFQMRHRSGSVSDMLISAELIELAGERYMLSLAQDITERKRAEEALRRKSGEQALLLDNIQTQIWYLTDGETYGAVNKARAEFFGKKNEEMENKKLYDVLSKNEAEICMSGYVEVFEKRKRIHTEKWIANAKGEKRLLSIIKSPKLDENGDIEYVVCSAEDITERKRAEEQLKNSTEQLRALSTHLQSIREEERTLVAREIHDELGQELTGLKMDLSWLVRRLSKNQKSLISKTESMLKLVDSTIQTVRRISSELRPGVLDDLGLIAAIEWQAQDFENRTGITCIFSSNLEEIDLDQDRSTAVFRIFQETMTNVSRHANATRVNITLGKSADTLMLRIEDNGRGIKESEVSHPKYLGLLGMHERVLLFGGEVEISGIPGKGTTVTVTIPMRQRKK